jgi:uncharacterized protein involved in exopolysaccharide biosynthesis
MTQSYSTPILDNSEQQAGNGEVAPGSREKVLRRLRFLWNERRFVFLTTGVGLAAAVLVAFLLPSRYTAQGRLMPPDNASQSLGLGMLTEMSGRLGNFGGFAGDVLGVKTSGALFIGILDSATVQERLVDRFKLRQAYGKRLNVDARKELEENTGLSEDRRSGIITITVTDRSAQRASDLVKGYVEELDRLVSSLSTSSAHRERLFLEDRIKTVKQDLDAAAQRLGQFSSRNTAINLEAQGRVMLDIAANLQGQLTAAQAQLQGLRQIYADGNVRVREMKARIAELQRKFNELDGRGTSGNGKFSPSNAEGYPSIRDLPLLGVTYTDLYRQTKIEESIYQTLTQQYELAKVQEVKETPSVKVLDVANIPERRSFPPRLLIVSSGTMLSFVIASLWVLTRAEWQSVGPGDPRKTFVLEMLEDARADLHGTSRDGVLRSLLSRARRGPTVSHSSEVELGKKENSA